MKISVKIKPNSRQEKIEKIGEKEFILYVNAPAKEDKANKRVVELLGKYFDVAKTRVVILRGHNSRNKIIEMI
ncbi:MAG: DUF167 domain-containing protein [Candidatus Omnitrophica bacterium]|nr:DUF167 domain-containing protein [Candidatus Omnitrophota bacterium]